ncbi:MAG: hypothetical protein L3J22_08230 [Xanthomonadales bacterium]|nr:hypothetical protein [Xanthomonadales bacterium]
MKNYISILILSTAFFLSSCDSDNSATEPKATTTNSDLFAFVPADTPYLAVAMEGIPKELMEKYLQASKPNILSIQNALSQASEPKDTAAEDSDSDSDSDSATETADTDFDLIAFGASLLDQYANNMSVEGLRNLGLDPSAKSVVYGLGPFPVFRMSISDQQKLRNVLNQAFAAGGEIPPEKEFNGRKYWQIGDHKITTIASIGETEVSIAVVATSMLEEALPNILGQSRPDNAMNISSEMVKFNQKHSYTNYSSGWFEPESFLNLFLNDNSSASKSLRELLKIDAAIITPVCKSEFTAIAATIPLVHFGTNKIDQDEVIGSMGIDLKTDTAKQLQQLTVANTLNSSYTGSFMDFGFAMDIAKLREQLLATTKERVDSPYKCEQLAGLNSMYSMAYENLNRPLPPFLANLFGVAVSAEEFDFGMALQGNQSPFKNKFLLSILTSSPEILVDMGQMFMPELADLSLTPGGDPQEVELGVIPTGQGPVWGAMSDSALGIAMGADMNTKLSAFLDSGNSKDGEFFTVSMRSEVFAKLQESFAHLVPEEDMSQADFTGMEALMDLYEGIFLKASMTETGIVFEQQAKFK